MLEHLVNPPMLVKQLSLSAVNDERQLARCSSHKR